MIKISSRLFAIGLPLVVCLTACGDDADRDQVAARTVGNATKTLGSAD